MDTLSALTQQYRAALKMLRSAVKKCPADLWIAGTPPRTFSRIAYHALFYTHWYMGENSKDFDKWKTDYEGAAALWQPPCGPEFTQTDVLAYLKWLDGEVESKLAKLDLNDPTSGFSWYKMEKMEFVIMNLRHLQQHVGQLCDRLLERGIDVKWEGYSG